MKTAIIGYSGAGKSTLAKAIAQAEGCPLLYLDRVNFQENWKERDSREALEIVRAFMEHEAWVIDGNYQAMDQFRRLEEAQRIIFMDYSRWTCFWQALGRYWSNRGNSRESIAQGCLEKFDLEFAKWILWEGRTPERKAHYASLVKRYPDKMLVLKNPRQTAALLAVIRSAG